MSRQMIGTRGNLTSSMGTTAAQGVALGTAVNISERPVTQQGMRGMKTTHGPARKVQDSSYYVTELTTEIYSLQTEHKQHERSVNEHGGLQKHHDSLLNRVRILEGTLADYNLALDKARVSTDPVELDEYISGFRAKNKQFANEVDRIFVIKKQKDEETKKLDTQIQEVHELIRCKIADLDTDKLALYSQLLGFSLELSKKQDVALADVDSLISQVDNDSGDQRQHFSDDYAQLLKRHTWLQKEEGSLAEEVAIWELSDPSEALLNLKHRVEAQSKQIRRCEESTRRLREQIEAAQTQLAEFHDEMKERKVEASSDSEKYEKLRQRETEMSQFISQFEATRELVAQDQVQAQDTIATLLEHISQGLEQRSSMPSQQRLREMRDEASFKERQLESSQHTTLRLTQERKQREAEMAKIETLEEKIQIELSSLQQKMKMMQSDMIEFDDVNGLRKRASTTMTALSRLIKEYQGRRESVKCQVTQLTSKYEALKGKIQSSEAARSLSTLEAKLRTYGQTIFHLREYAETKTRETDYTLLKDSCMATVEKLNTHAKTAVNMGHL